MFEVIRKFVLEFVSPDGHSSGTVAERVTSLDHEFRYHAMEDNTLVVSAASVPNEILHSLRGLLREQSEMHVSYSGVYGCGIGHWGWASFESWRSGSDGLLLAGRPLL